MANDQAHDTRGTSANRLAQAVGLSVAARAALIGGYTITGAGFGTLDQTAQFFTDFEDDAVGSAVLDVPGKLYKGSSNGTEISDLDTYSGTRCLTHYSQTSTFPKIHLPLSGLSRRAYHSCHFKFTGQDERTEGGSLVWKFSRIGAGSLYSGSPKATSQFTSVRGTDAPVSWASGYSGICGVDTNTNSSHMGPLDGGAQAKTNGVWHFYECEFYAGTLDNSDSYFIERWDGRRTVNFQNRPFLRSDTADCQLLPTWFISAICGIDQGHAFTKRMDNVLFNESGARVIMTDSATYANSTKWAAQPIDVYSDSQVTITKKRQGFNIGESAYLHLFNPEGVLVSEGTQLTVEADV